MKIEAILYAILHCLITGAISAQDKSDSVYTYLEDKPVFNIIECVYLKNKKAQYECSEARFLRYLDDHKEYPEEAFKNNISGKVTAQFVINKNGKIEDIRILRGLGYGCEEDLIRILERLNDRENPWMPGYHNKKPVSCLKTVTVKYEPMIFGWCKSGDKSFIAESGMEDVYSVDELDRLPVHPDCGEDKLSFYLISKCSNTKLHQDIYSTLRYPREQMASGIDGKATAQFILTKEGKISKIKVIQSTDSALSKAVADTFENIRLKNQTWKPGLKNGREVNTMIEFDFSFAAFNSF